MPDGSVGSRRWGGVLPVRLGPCIGRYRPLSSTKPFLVLSGDNSQVSTPREGDFFRSFVRPAVPLVNHESLVNDLKRQLFSSSTTPSLLSCVLDLSLLDQGNLLTIQGPVGTSSTSTKGYPKTRDSSHDTLYLCFGSCSRPGSSSTVTTTPS